jgi:drug/metabolite transporter (DMT)-like permease
MAVSTARSRFVDVLSGLGLVVAWSSGFIGAELGTSHASASTLLAWRYVAAAALLAICVAWTRRNWRIRDPSRHALIGLFCQAIYLGGVVVGVGLGVPPGTAALIAAWQPLAVAGLEHMLSGRSTGPMQRVGLALGVVGVALVVSSDISRGDASAWVYLLPVTGMLGLAVGTVLDRHWRLENDLISGLTAQTLPVAVVMVAGAQVTGHLTPPASPSFWVAVAWVVVLSTFGGYGLYFWVLRRSGAAVVSAWLYLTPPCTMLWAAAFFGDHPGVWAYAGTIVCAAAVLIALKGADGPTPAAARPDVQASDNPTRTPVPHAPSTCSMPLGSD